MKNEQDIVKLLEKSIDAKSASNELIGKLETLQKANKERLEKGDALNSMGTLERERIQKTQAALDINLPRLRDLSNVADRTVKQLTALIEIRQSFHLGHK